MTINQLRNKVANIIAPERNAINLPQQFLRYGNKQMPWDWSQVLMEDKDIYSGYAYAAIRKRANAVATLAKDNLRTLTKLNDADYTHPYLETLKKSPTFTDYSFWHDVSTYLDLEGVYYLMAIRAISEGRVGAIKEFKMLNPYHIRRVLDGDNMTVTGYVETRNGMVREIPAGLIIPIRELNPFDDDLPYAMTDAAKESQFTLKTAGDYTRNALQHNINAPGIISTDVILEKDEFENFVNRVRNHTKGEPLFGNGQGAITYQNMQTELSKAALRDVTEINKEVLMAVSGVSKTIMGIEESGTTRETARVQKELNVESEILPRIQLIIDALNQDYQNNYASEYEKNEAIIIVDNPLSVDHDADIKEVDLKTKQLDLYTSMINKGFDANLSAQYVAGNIDIEDLGKPTNEPLIEKIMGSEGGREENEEALNRFDDDTTIQYQQNSLQNSIVNIEQQILMSAIKRLNKAVKNEFNEDWEVVSKSEKNESIKELALLLGGFYGIVMAFKGGEVMRDRVGKYAMPGIFTLDKNIRKYIKQIAGDVAESHINTIADDIYKTAREAALQGNSLIEIESKLRTAFSQEISQNRAKTVARTETNRAFTRSQYEADKQFIQQNGLEGKAYKRWITRSLNPCPYCQSLEKQGLIPFDNAFKNLGDVIKVDGKELQVNFEELQAGNAHPNCSCIYELVLK